MARKKRGAIPADGVPVIARHHLIGYGQDTLPGEIHVVATMEEAEHLVARGAADWPDEPRPEPKNAAAPVRGGEQTAAEQRADEAGGSERVEGDGKGGTE